MLADTLSGNKLPIKAVIAVKEQGEQPSSTQLGNSLSLALKIGHGFSGEKFL